MPAKQSAEAHCLFFSDLYRSNFTVPTQEDSRATSSSVCRSFLQSRQTKCAESGKGYSAKNVYQVEEQQVDCIPHRHPCKEYRIRLNPSDCLQNRRNAQGTDPAQICAEEKQSQLLGNGRKQESEYIKPRFLLFATLP